MEHRGAGVRVSLPALELPREQCGAHPASTRCLRAVSQLPLSQGGGVSLYLCSCLPHSLQLLEQSPSMFWKGAMRVRGWQRA